MKRTMMNSLMAVALVAGSALHAQSTQKIHANVPFDFQAGKIAMAAGDYSIAPLSDNSVLTLKIADRNHVKVSGMANGITTKQDKGRPRLVFAHVDGQYFLTQVCNGEDCTQMTKQRRQRDIEAKAGASAEMVAVDAIAF